MTESISFYSRINPFADFRHNQVWMQRFCDAEPGLNGVIFRPDTGTNGIVD